MYSSIPQHLAYIDQSVHQCGLSSAVGTAVLAKIKNTPQESAFFIAGIGVMDWVSMSTQCICYRKKEKTRSGRKTLHWQLALKYVMMNKNGLKVMNGCVDISYYQHRFDFFNNTYELFVLCP